MMIRSERVSGGYTESGPLKIRISPLRLIQTLRMDGKAGKDVDLWVIKLY